MQSWKPGDRANPLLVNLHKSSGISQIVHSAAVLDIHKDYIVEIKSSGFKFIWKEKQDKIKRKVLYQDYERGGLRVTHVETLCNEFKGS